METARLGASYRPPHRGVKLSKDSGRDGFASNAASAASRTRPVGVAIDGDGALLVADDVGDTVERVTSVLATRTQRRSLAWTIHEIVAP
jgi:hypothetical protein